MCAACQHVNTENVHWFNSRRIIYTEISESSLAPFSIPVLGLTACEAIALLGYHTGMKQKIGILAVFAIGWQSLGLFAGENRKKKKRKMKKKIKKVENSLKFCFFWFDSLNQLFLTLRFLCAK